MSRSAATADRTLPAASSRSRELSELDGLADLLDTKWRVPGTNLRFGVDAIAGLIPGAGDAATGLVSAYIIYKGAKLGVPAHITGRMIGNVALDTIIGSVPLLGSIFDLFFKANRRNMRLLRNHFEHAA